MKIGDLVKHYDQLYAGLGLVVCIDAIPNATGDAVDFVRVQYSDVTDWFPVEDQEVVSESR
jgi:hypothetical protein